MPTGYGITTGDMEASRLVFVSVRDAKPRRKVAIPLPDGFTWEAFMQQVQVKLKLIGVDGIYLASSGERVVRLDDLQDIDELHVVEAKPPPPVSAAAVASGGNGDPNVFAARPDSGAGAPGLHGNGAGPDSAYRQSDQRHRVGVADTEITPLEVEAQDQDTDADTKYIKRQSALQRSLKRLIPSAFQPTLPVTTRDLAQERPSGGPARRRRRQRGVLDPRNLVFIVALMACLGTMVYIYSRFGPNLP